MKRSRRIHLQDQAYWRPHLQEQQRSVTGKIYASGQFTVNISSGGTAALPSQICDDLVISSNAAPPAPWNVPLDASLTTVTTNASANTFVQLASATNVDQLVIFNQSAASVLNVGFNSAPGNAVVPIAANGNFTFNLGTGSNANRLWVASAGSSQVFSYLIRQMANAQILIGSAAFGTLLLPGTIVVVPVPAGPTYTGNANQISITQFNPAGSSLNFGVMWRRYSI